MLSFLERYFDGADPAAPAAPGQRDLLAGSIWGYPGRDAPAAPGRRDMLAGSILGYPGRGAERMQYWRRPGEGRGKVSRSAYAALA